MVLEDKHGYGNLPVLQLRTAAAPSEPVLNELVQRLLEEGLRPGVVADMPGEKYDSETLFCSCDLLVVQSPGGVCTTTSTFVEPGESWEAGVSSAEFHCAQVHNVADGMPMIKKWLLNCMERTPVLGCILIGGKSSRMGRPKHLLAAPDGRTWLEITVARLRPHVTEVLVSGPGDIPGELAGIPRIKDLPGVAGPMAGIGSVLEKYRFSSCLAVACDMPDLDAGSIVWLLSRKRPGRVAVVPKNSVTGHSEPLFAWYDFRARPCFRGLIDSARYGMYGICRCPGVYQPVIPYQLSGRWRNVNRPEEL